MSDRGKIIEVMAEVIWVAMDGDPGKTECRRAASRVEISRPSPRGQLSRRRRRGC
jgi:hypothetical protein